MVIRIFHYRSYVPDPVILWNHVTDDLEQTFFSSSLFLLNFRISSRIRLKFGTGNLPQYHFIRATKFPSPNDQVSLWPHSRSGRVMKVLLCSTVVWKLPVLGCVWNVMARVQKPEFVFRRNGRVHLNRRGRHSFDCWQPRCAQDGNPSKVEFLYYRFVCVLPKWKIRNLTTVNPCYKQ